MKEFFKKLDKETLLAGIFGLVAIIAIVFEMVLAEFESASIAGAIKDIAGTILDVVMLIIALKIFKPKKKAVGGFEDKFNEEMDRIIAKYNPLIKRDAAIIGRCNIADDMSVLYRSIDCNYHCLFDLQNKDTLSFAVSKTLFMGRSKEDFFELQKQIVDSIAAKVTREYSILNDTYKPTQDGFKLSFSRELLTPEDAVEVAEVIDKIILLYIVEYKKK